MEAENIKSGTVDVGPKVCANCRRPIAAGHAVEFMGLFYGSKCAQMVKGEIRNSKKNMDHADQDSLEDFGPAS